MGEYIGRNINNEVTDHEKRILALEELIYGNDKKGIEGIALWTSKLRKYIYKEIIIL